MDTLKKVVFEYYFTEMPLEWDEYEYFSNDLSVSVNMPLFSQRACLLNTVVDFGITDEATAASLTDYDLERLLLDNNIYVEFVDGDSYEDHF